MTWRNKQANKQTRNVTKKSIFLILSQNTSFLREYDSQERAASEVKQEIERHLADKETLENSLPSSIVIGAFWISTEGVKQVLAKKRKALANAVIELLAKKLRKQADMVRASVKI